MRAATSARRRRALDRGANQRRPGSRSPRRRACRGSRCTPRCPSRRRAQREAGRRAARRARFASRSPSAAERADELLAAARVLAERREAQGLDVELGDDEAELAARGVEVDVAPDADDGALGKVEPGRAQRRLEGSPRRAPALRLQRRRVAPGDARVDEVEVAVSRAVVGELLDLAEDPDLAGRAPTDRRGTPSARRRAGRSTGCRRRRRRSVPSTSDASNRLPRQDGRAVARGRLSADGEPAGWPRRFGVEEGRGSAGQGAREASRGDPKESATENRPPMAGDGTGKGETVR